MKHIKLFEDYNKEPTREYTKRGENEEFNFMSKTYDIEKAWELINANPEKYLNDDGELHSVSMEETAKMFSGETKNDDGSTTLRMGVAIDRDYADTLTEEQLKEGGIFVVDDRDSFNFMIDGWHRAYKKNLNGDTTMEVYAITDPKDVEYIRVR